MVEYSGSKVLVTGGAGFIGAELVLQLVREGANVTVLDNLVTGKRVNLDGIVGPQMNLVVGDIRNEALVSAILDEIDLVFHLACLGVRHSIHSPYENHDVNAGGTLKLLRMCQKAKVRRFVHVSSSEVYGTARMVPMSEQHPTYPATVYGASKLAGECYARAFCETYGFETIVVRPFNTYGPRCHHEGDSGEVIPKFMLRCIAGYPMVVFGDGSQTRDFTYVSDTARGIVLAGQCDQAVGKTLNLGTGQELTIADLARKVAVASKCPEAKVVYDAPRPGDTLRLCSDISLARSLLGYEPRVGFDEGLANLRSWYQNLDKSPEILLEEEIVHNWELGGNHHD